MVHSVSYDTANVLSSEWEKLRKLEKWGKSWHWKIRQRKTPKTLAKTLQTLQRRTISCTKLFARACSTGHPAARYACSYPIATDHPTLRAPTNNFENHHMGCMQSTVSRFSLPLCSTKTMKPTFFLTTASLVVVSELPCPCPPPRLSLPAQPALKNDLKAANGSNKHYSLRMPATMRGLQRGGGGGHGNRRRRRSMARRS